MAAVLEMSPLAEQAVVLAFTLHRPGLVRKVNVDQITTDADKDLLRVSKHILESPEFKTIARHDEQTRDFIKSRALPFPFKQGVYLLPLALLETVEQELSRCNRAREVLIDEALAVYPRLITQDRERLGSLFNADNYPERERLREAYGRELQYLTLSVPAALQAVSPDLYAREQAAAVEQWEEAARQSQTLLRQTLYDLVGRAAERLADANGKPKVFRDSLLTHLQDFSEVFDARNLAQDYELSTLVIRVRRLIEDVDAQDLRQDGQLRASVQAGMSEVKEALEALPLTRQRRIRFAPDGQEVA
jgi:hypothetical protein